VGKGSDGDSDGDGDEREKRDLRRARGSGGYEAVVVWWVRRGRWL
jgi:hypothetical protein